MTTKKALKILGERLAELRNKKGLTQKDFCKRHKLPIIHYWRIEHGKANITMKSLGRLCAIHKCTMGEILKDL